MRLFFLFFVLGLAAGVAAEDPDKAQESPLYTWDLLWTGSYYNSFKSQEDDAPSAEDVFSDGTLYNRLNFSLGLPQYDLSVRVLATDKRLLPLSSDDNKAGFNPALGVYHLTSASRILLGVQSEYGLSARVKNVWLRSAPYIESRSPSSRDLKVEPAAKDESEAYLYLALPPGLLPGFSAFASAALDADLNPALTSGIGLEIGEAKLRIEGFYTQKELSARTISTWFSSSPPLPERDFNIYALGMIFSIQQFSFASDWAWSETFAWGKGLYGNFALRLGDKPWRFSLAGDGAGSRFSGRDGATTGAGFRTAAKLEHFMPRSGLFRFQGLLRSPAPEEPFNRLTLSLYFRPSAQTAAQKRKKSFPVGFSRASFSLSRDARELEKTADSLDALAAFYFGPLNFTLSCSLHCLSTLYAEDNDSHLFNAPFFDDFSSFKVSGELGFKIGLFDIKTKLAVTARAEKDALWEPSVNCSVKPGKWGRVGLKIASTDFPKKWNYTLSWRFQTINR